MVPRELTPASFETMTHFYEAWFFMKMVSNEAGRLEAGVNFHTIWYRVSYG